MPRLIRKRPLKERVLAYLNPWDFLLWASEEIETRDWDTKSFANPVGLGLNFVFLLARANTGSKSSSFRDDVFSDTTQGPGWLKWLATLIVHALTWFSLLNAAFTFLRTRHYRLFESSVDVAPRTPSAHRVRVDSSPVSSSPLRFLTAVIGNTTAQSRAHPDPTRDVWELAVWDPLPACLRLFCLFSPGHVLVYWLFLPIMPADPRPSTTVATTIFLQMLLSTQMLLLQTKFSQQTKDSAIIHREVMNEYDIKYVHPNLHPQVRDVGTQFSADSKENDVVSTHTPTTIISRGFKTNPNPNYTRLTDPDNVGELNQRELRTPLPAFQTPATKIYPRRESSPVRGIPSAVRQPQFRQNSGTSTSHDGSLGVYTHPNSPLKKTSSMYDLPGGRLDLPKNNLQAARRELADERERSMSPVKKLRGAENENARRRTSVPAGFGQHLSDSGHRNSHGNSRGYF